MRCAPLYRDLEDMSSANSTTALLRTMRGGNIFRNTDAFDFFFCLLPDHRCRTGYTSVPVYYEIWKFGQDGGMKGAGPRGYV